MNRLTLKPEKGAIQAWTAAAGELAVEDWAIRLLNRAATFGTSNSGMSGISEGKRGKYLAFRLNWSEDGVKKSTTVSFTKETRAEKMLEAQAILKQKRGW